MKARHFALYMGYVEESSTTTLLLSHETGFDSVEEALQSLGKAIRSGLERQGSRFSVVCPTCHQRMPEPVTPTKGDIGLMVEDLFRSTLGDAGVLSLLEEEGWTTSLGASFWGQPPIVVSNCEVLIADAAFQEREAFWEDFVDEEGLPEGVTLYKQED